jgi:CHASE2 domain-containing sensor protein
MSLDKNPQTLIDLWGALPEPVKAATFSLVLGLLMALRSKEPKTLKKFIEVVTACVLGFGVGYAAHLAGLPSWVPWCANMAIAVMGVDKARDVIDALVNKYVYGKEPKIDG